jgi:hypothetical protein
LKEYRKNANKIDQLETSNMQINKLKNNLGIAMFHAFLSYTPLIKSQITVELFLTIFSLLLRLGIKSLKIEKVLDYLSWLKEEIKDFSNHAPQHA